jgi:hypothetical protein
LVAHNGDSHFISVTLDQGTWYRVGYAWNVSTDTHSLSFVAEGDAASWTDDTGDDLTTFTNAPTGVYVGEYQGNNSIDNVIYRVRKMAIMKTYKATDPFYP